MMPVLPQRLPLKTFRLGVFLFVCLEALLAAQTEEREPLKALIEIRGESIVEHTPFTLSILVNHPRPDEISVEPPDFHEEFFLERLRSKIRIMTPAANARRLQDPADDSHIWTELELLIVPAAPGEFSIGAFSILSPDEHVYTLPVQLRVLPGQEDIYLPLLGWTGVQPIRLGAEGGAVLAVINHKRGMPVPESLGTGVQAPPNAIIDTLALSPSDKTAGIMLRLLVRPLDTTDIQIAAFSVPYRGYYLMVPALNFKVLPSLEKTSKDSGAQVSSVQKKDTEETAESLTDDSLRPFPSAGTIPGILAAPDGARFHTIITEVKEHWLSGNYAASLALLRAGERDLIAGPYLAHLRRVAESSLGLPLAKNEVWLPVRLFTLIGGAGLAGILILIARYLFVRLYRKKKNRLGIKWLCAAVILVFVGGAGLFSNITGTEKNAVLRTCDVYNVPEPEQERVTLFVEGTPVLVNTKTENWLYVEASNGSSGWIIREYAVFY